MPAVPTLLETIASYVPVLSLRRFSPGQPPLDQPERDRFPAALLFADISGFTALSERLAQRGPSGAEDLINILNTYFGMLNELIYAHGGDIVKFAGDALLVLWPAASEADLALQTRRAAQCALAMPAALAGVQAPEGVRLSLRVGLGAGEVALTHLGGISGRWDLMVTGLPLTAIGTAMPLVAPGEVVVTPEAWELLQDRCVARPLAAGNVQLLSVRDPFPPERTVIPPLAPDAEAALRCFLPDAILSRLEAGQNRWLAELRQVTVLFVNLPGMNHATSLAEAQRAAVALQTAIDRFEGSINKLSVDDKGVTLVAAMGLPPLAHEDDATRGVLAAMAIQKSFRELGMPCSVGVTTGRAFCGEVGNDRRREYTLIGDIVNLAARLMQAASGGILCDFATQQAAQQRVDFVALSALKLKGKSGPIGNFRPVGEAKRRSLDTSAMIGRAEERLIVAERLEELRAGGGGGVIVLEGEAGIGKSCMVADIARQAAELGLAPLVGGADAIEKASPYHAWHPVFNQVFRLEGVEEPSTRRARVLEHLAHDPELLRLAPLLNPVLALDLPENDLTALMTGEVRANNTRTLLLRLLQPSAGEARVVLLEDAHWFDSASWALAVLAGRQSRSMLVVLTTRPLPEPLRPEYRQLMELPGTRLIRLGPLPPDEVLQLVCLRLGVKSLPHPVAALIKARAEGHPFFSEEIAYALRDAGLIRIQEGECRLAVEAGDFSALNLPDTVQGVITSRVDRLAPSVQLALKVASVIGREFSLRALRDLLPIEADKPLLDVYMETLRQLDLTPLETPDPDLSYIFKHVTTQEVVYNLMLFAQRQQLHRSVAEWCERAYADDLAPYYALLSHHWRKGEELAKAIAYLELAGDQALRNGAHQEAIGFFNEILTLAPHAEAGQRGSWERRLGEAYVSLGRMTEGREHLERSVSLLGYPVPSGRHALALGLAAEALIQLWRSVRPRGSRSDESAAGRCRLEGARAYERLFQIYFHANLPVLVLLASLRTTNMAPDPSPELARGLSNLAGSTGFLALHGLADSYARRARAMARNHPTAQGWVTMVTGIRDIGSGHLSASRSALEQVLEMAERVGDRRRWGEACHWSAQAAYHQGDFKHANRRFIELVEAGRRRGDASEPIIGCLGQVQCQLALGDLDQALAHVESVHSTLTDSGSAHEIWGCGMQAVGLLRLGDRDQSMRVTERFERLFAGRRPVGGYAFEGYAGAAEACLAALEAAGPSERAAIARMARRLCGALNNYGRVFPAFRPRARLWQGLYEWLAGRSSRAQREWLKGLRAAEQWNMPFEQGLAHYEIGRHLPSNDPERHRHLVRAGVLFERLGAAYHRDRVAAALQG